MPQIGFTDKQAHVYARFQKMRRDYEDKHGRTYAPDFLTVLMDTFEVLAKCEELNEAEQENPTPKAQVTYCVKQLDGKPTMYRVEEWEREGSIWEPVSLRAYIADAEANDPGLTIDPRIGKRVRCLYGNSGHKFYSKFLDTNPVILEVRKNSGGAPDSFSLGFKGGDDWWYANDFEILEPVNDLQYLGDPRNRTCHFLKTNGKCVWIKVVRRKAGTFWTYLCDGDEGTLNVIREAAETGNDELLIKNKLDVVASMRQYAQWKAFFQI